MKRLFFIRHAKSSWDNPTLDDYDRPLNDRGNEDKKSMPQYLLSAGYTIEYLVASASKRTRATAQSFVEIMKIPNADYKKELYHASSSQLLQQIHQLDNQYFSVAIVVHNIGITQICNQLSPLFTIDNIPTCGVCIFKGPDSWNKWQLGGVHYEKFLTPKNF